MSSYNRTSAPTRSRNCRRKLRCQTPQHLHLRSRADAGRLCPFLVSQDNTRTSRSSIYVSTHIKRMITEVVKKIGREHMTVTAYVDNILRHHLELYKDDINRIHKEQNSKNII